MPYPSASLYPQASGLYPGDGLNELAPVVVTGPVSNVSFYAATFSGTINPNGLTTHYYWEFNGHQSAEYNAGAGAVNVAVSKSVSLVPGHYYTGRLVAFNGAGFGYGAYFGEFHTPALPLYDDLPEFVTDAGRGQ